MKSLYTVLLEQGWALDEIRESISEFRECLLDCDYCGEAEELFMDIFGLEPDYMIEVL